MLHGDLAVYHGIVHGTADAYGAQDGLGIVAGAYQLQTAAVDHKQVGALTYGDLTDVVPAQQTGAATGGHLQNIVAGGGFAAGIQPM